MKNLEDYLKTPYRVNIIPDSNEGGYTAYYPDLPGCITCFESLDDLKDTLYDAKKYGFNQNLNKEDKYLNLYMMVNFQDNLN